jgi:hypothetical protein
MNKSCICPGKFRYSQKNEDDKDHRDHEEMEQELSELLRADWKAALPLKE